MRNVCLLYALLSLWYVSGYCNDWSWLTRKGNSDRKDSAPTAADYGNPRLRKQQEDLVTAATITTADETKPVPAPAKETIPRLLLHIGPHKTASTYIQKFITDHHTSLEAENWHWPFLHDKGDVNQQHSYIPLEIRGHHHGTMNKLQVFLRQALITRRNVILSSEGFDRLTVTEVRKLVGHLHGFNVTVVFVYREWLSLLTSWYYQMERPESSDFTDSFANYMYKKMDTLDHGLKTMTVLSNYQEVFGLSSMKVIDYYGVRAVNKNIAHVLLCEIAGTLCNQTALFDAAVEANVKTSLVTAQVYSHVIVQMTTATSCRYCASEKAKEMRALFTQNLADPDLTKHQPPTMKSSLGLLVPYAESVDHAVEEKYASVMLYASATANKEVREQKVHVEDLNVKEFYAGRYWKTYIQDFLKRAALTGILCGCNVTETAAR